MRQVYVFLSCGPMKINKTFFDNQNLTSRQIKALFGMNLCPIKSYSIYCLLWLLNYQTIKGDINHNWLDATIIINRNKKAHTYLLCLCVTFLFPFLSIFFCIFNFGDSKLLYLKIKNKNVTFIHVHKWPYIPLNHQYPILTALSYI